MTGQACRIEPRRAPAVPAAGRWWYNPAPSPPAPVERRPTMSKRRAAPPRAATTGGAAPTVRHLALDRFEEGRDGARLAVLVDEGGASIVVPAALLPAGAAAGGALTLTLALDPAAAAAVDRETREIRADLKKTDPGGTVQL